MTMRTNQAILAILSLLCLCADKPAAYHNDFKKAAVGNVPDDLMVLYGAFAVAQVDNNKVLELAGEPLESFGLLYGPSAAAGEISARIWGKSTGRRFPEFGIGAGDAGGYKLWLVPGQARIELRKGDIPKASAPYRQWKSGSWTRLRLRLGKTAQGGWKIEGKAWPDGAKESATWDVSVEDAQAPVAGRASAWGTPYSGQPIRFDDLSFSPG